MGGMGRTSRGFCRSCRLFSSGSRSFQPLQLRLDATELLSDKSSHLSGNDSWRAGRRSLGRFYVFRFVSETSDGENSHLISQSCHVTQ